MANMCCRSSANTAPPNPAPRHSAARANARGAGRIERGHCPGGKDAPRCNRHSSGRTCASTPFRSDRLAPTCTALDGDDPLVPDRRRTHYLGCLTNFSQKIGQSAYPYYVYRYVIDNFWRLRSPCHRWARYQSVAPQPGAQLGYIPHGLGQLLGQTIGITQAASTLSVIVSLAISPLTTKRARVISGKRLTMVFTCPGCTNMPRILVVWSARPSSP
jgi:hypothetical protein